MSERDPLAKIAVSDSVESFPSSRPFVAALSILRAVRAAPSRVWEDAGQTVHDAIRGVDLEQTPLQFNATRLGDVGRFVGERADDFHLLRRRLLNRPPYGQF